MGKCIQFPCMDYMYMYQRTCTYVRIKNSVRVYAELFTLERETAREKERECMQVLVYLCVCVCRCMYCIPPLTLPRSQPSVCESKCVCVAAAHICVSLYMFICIHLFVA
jgi:hypothetical protein